LGSTNPSVILLTAAGWWKRNGDHWPTLRLHAIKVLSLVSGRAMTRGEREFSA